MEISATGPALQGHRPITPASGAETTPRGQPVPAETRAADLLAADLQAQPEPTPALMAAQAAAALFVPPPAPDSPAGPAAEDSLILQARRAYAASSQMLEHARTLIDRLMLLPEPGDLAFEASKLPPLGPPAFGPAPADDGRADGPHDDAPRDDGPHDAAESADLPRRSAGAINSADNPVKAE